MFVYRSPMLFKVRANSKTYGTLPCIYSKLLIGFVKGAQSHAPAIGGRIQLHRSRTSDTVSVTVEIMTGSWCR